MDTKNSKEDYDEILKENLRLKRALQLEKGKKSIIKSLKSGFSKVSTNFLVGKGLKNSLLRLYEELPEGRVTKVTLADVSSHLIYRLTRVGAFAVIIGIIPFLILSIQTYILNSQNQLLKYQNQRLDQQINLEEGNRRSSLIFLMSNIMDKIGEELKAPRNRKNQLSDALIGRIVSLSQAMRPYRYLENDELIQTPLSPERGQLLISLTNSSLHESTYQKIFDKADFSYADLQNANFDESFLEGVHLQHANLKGASFKNSDLEYANLEASNLRNAEFDEAYMNGIKLNDADLHSSHLHNVKMTHAFLKGANFTNAQISGDFRFSIIDGIDLDNVKIGFLDLEGIEIRDPQIMAYVDTADVASIFEFPVASREYLNENFSWKKQYLQNDDKSKSGFYKLTRKKASTLSTMDNCLKKVLEIIKSSNNVQQIERDAKKKKENLTYLIESNPFGDEKLGISPDSVYRYRLTTEEAAPLFSIAWIEFDPKRKTIIKKTINDTIHLSFNKSLLKTFALECH
jgi:uncharacterized protein YjbI with pentapeptide repeats